ncbi:MAG: DNA polymerase III subunit delta' [Pseudomonadota bacterium]
MATRSRKRSDDAPPPSPDRIEGAPHPAETRVLHGQHRAERAFLDAWARGRLAHGWLLCGPEGIGKATLAYRIARATIASTTPLPSLDVPPDCPVAARIRGGAEPRLRVLRRALDDKTGKLRTRIAVEDMRAVKGFLQFSVPDGGWRVVIVDAADEMNANAANAMLKFLEEPPPATLILLVAHAVGALLPTIRSRCRLLDLRPLGADDLGAALSAAGQQVDNPAALAALSGGSAGRAVRLLSEDGLALYERLVGLLGERLDRPALVGLAAVSASAEGRAKLALIADLSALLLARLARAAATGTPPPGALPAEQALAARVAARPEQAEPWAEAATRLTAAAAAAQAVNLDPGQTILDMWLDLDATLARAAAV